VSLCEIMLNTRLWLASVIYGVVDVRFLLTTVSRLTVQSQSEMTKMLKAMEKDKCQGRYVVWLRFTPALSFNDCQWGTVMKFMNGELLYY